MCLLPSSANLFKTASTSKSAGAEKEQDLSDVSVSISAIPSTLFNALRTEASQPPQVMPGSFSETVCVPDFFDVAAPSLSAGLASSSAFDQPAICLLPSSANLFNTASTSISAGATNEADCSAILVSRSTMPSTLVNALRTEDSQPPQVMPGSLSDTVWVPADLAVAESPAGWVAAAVSPAASPVFGGAAVSSAFWSQPIEMANNAIAIQVKNKRISIFSKVYKRFTNVWVVESTHLTNPDTRQDSPIVFLISGKGTRPMTVPGELPGISWIWLSGSQLDSADCQGSRQSGPPPDPSSEPGSNRGESNGSGARKVGR